MWYSLDVAQIDRASSGTYASDGSSAYTASSVANVSRRSLAMRHHPDIEAFVGWAHAAELPVVGIDNLPGSRPLESVRLPYRCALLFGQEGPGLSNVARAACDRLFSIAQYGSTRSINAGVASGIAMHAWVREYAEPPPDGD